MKAPLAEILRRVTPSPQAELPLAAEGMQRYVLQHRWDEMLIEVTGDRVFVDRKSVEPSAAADMPRLAGGGDR